MEVSRKIPEKPKLKRSVHPVLDTNNHKKVLSEVYFNKLLEAFFTNTISEEDKKILFNL